MFFTNAKLLISKMKFLLIKSTRTTTCTVKMRKKDVSSSVSSDVVMVGAVTTALGASTFLVHEQGLTLSSDVEYKKSNPN
ncbi:hypothetical protein L1987_57163 [Smallanthus sonchifolius]|uniref:Uncharacterized protein n=1 Tax=Smallanthus sonchifolius TaxID=185202 RepID=A0ACB9DC95_9ASTR|nr:hypothetical protein L1987_57163 [Smallanthus sonchifolius]